MASSVASAAGSAAVRGCSAPIFGSRAPQQLETLQHLVTRHIQEPSLCEIVSTADFAPTSTERGVSHWEHSHVVAALDVLNAYQRDRRASVSILGHRAGFRRQYRQDARTRLVELLKRWLRTQAGNASIVEDELRSISGLCRDVLNHPKLFPAKNQRSFMRSLAEVYDHLQWQLREVLERDRTCADLAQRVLSSSKNLLSDAIVYLLLAPTDLKQTDKVASLEVVALWQSLPAQANPLPSRADPQLQNTMRDAWRTRCGSLIAAVVATPWCVSLFDGAGAKEEAAAALAESANAADGPKPSEVVSALLEEMRTEFDQGRFKNSGLAGVLRRPDMRLAREHYMVAVEMVFDLAYLLGEALVQFHRISDGLGDYGMIRVAPWLHPFLEVLVEKVQKLKSALEQLNDSIERGLNLARARGQKVDSPAPSLNMSSRAQYAIARAIMERGSHAQSLLQALEELRARSAPERLPHLVECIGDACTQLQVVLSSTEFRARVGDAFRELPTLGNGPSVVETSGAALSAAPTSMVEAVDAFAFANDEEEEPVQLLRQAPTPSLAGCSKRRHGSSGSRSPSASPAVADSDASTRPSLGVTPKKFGSQHLRGEASESTVILEEAYDNSSQSGDCPGNPFDNDVVVALSSLDGLNHAENDVNAHATEGLSQNASLEGVSGPMPPKLQLSRSGCLSPSTTADWSDGTSTSNASARTSDMSARSREDAFILPRFGGSLGSSSRSLSTGALRQMPGRLPMPRGRSPASASLRSFSPAGASRPLSEVKRGDAGELQAEVYRLTTGYMGNGWRRHDRRSVGIRGGFLHVFGKGSSVAVKLVVDIARDVDDCNCISGNVLSLSLRKRTSMVEDQSGACAQKLYFFEFASASCAATYHEEITRLRAARA